MYVIFKWLKDGETWSKEFKERFAEIVTDQELIAITREISRKSRESRRCIIQVLGFSLYLLLNRDSILWQVFRQNFCNIFQWINCTLRLFSMFVVVSEAAL